MQLDPFASALIALLAAAAMSAGLYAAASRQPQELAGPQRIWARALVMAPLGWLLLEWSDEPSGLSVAGKTLIIAAFVEYLRALVSSRGRMPDSPWFAAPVALVAVASAIALFMQPDAPMRTGLLSLVCAGVAASTAVVALAWRNPRTGNSAIVAVAFMICAVVLLARGGLLLLPQGHPASAWMDNPWAETLLLGGAMFAPAVASLGFVLMGSDRLLERLEGIANTDSLTGLLARHAFLQQASARLAGSPGSHCALLIVDLDHFKRINDGHGHDVGDQALRLVADAMARVLREGDLLGRLGGEEFTVLLPDTGIEEAGRIARELHAAVARIAFVADGRPVPLRVSVGVSAREKPEHELELLLKRADQAMYEAKRSGRDQVRVLGAG